MIIGVPLEVYPGERRVPLVPESAARLVKKGATVNVESGLGNSIGVSDAAYEQAGACVVTDHSTLLQESDLILRLRRPPFEEIDAIKRGAIHISHMDPFNETDLVDEFSRCGVSCIAMEMIPRTTLAQKMDALSSQANLAGYVAVLLAAERIDLALPMMMTPAGTIKPARVFIIGVGVAGLQAIATAKRLGARVEAFDTRPEVEEQVQSLGAKFVKVDLGETGKTKDGYAQALSPEQLALQQQTMAKVIAQSDIVITTAQVFGRKAPRIVTTAMVASMRPGSVVIDMAAESGGNVECSVPDKEIEVNDVKVIGLFNLPGHVAAHASQMYSANLCNLVEHFWDKESNGFKLNLDDEILKGCLIVHEGVLRNEMLKKARGK
jgi:NAD(P) transhydrogenase subunit alpha